MDTPHSPGRPYTPSEAKKKDTRIFEYTHTSTDKADRAALGYFQIDDSSILQREILRQGRRAFLLFGPSKKTFKYTLKPIYKKLLTPFITEILRHSGLEVKALVGLKNRIVKVNFQGPDSNLLAKSGEYLLALESILRIYTAKRVFLPKNIRFRLECDASAPEGGRRERGKEGDGEETRDREDLMARLEAVKEGVRATGTAGVLKFLNPSQRRLVHQHIDEGDEFTTRSLGEGHYKRVEIALREGEKVSD